MTLILPNTIYLPTLARLYHWCCKTFLALPKELFPNDGIHEEIFLRKYGKRYGALMEIIRPAHPDYHHTPSTLNTDRPRQESISEYFYRYVYWMKLRAATKNIIYNLNSTL